MTDTVVATTHQEVVSTEHNHHKATRAETDMQLIEAWVSARRSVQTQRMYRRVGAQVMTIMHARGISLRTLMLEDARDVASGIVAGLEAASSRQTITAVFKSLLSFAHRTGYLPFNAGTFIESDKGKQSVAQRIMPEAHVARLFDAARTPRDRLMFRIADYGGLRVSELISITWSQCVPRDHDRMQIAGLSGKGGKIREVLLPAAVSREIAMLSLGTNPSARIFPVSARRVNHIIKAACRRSGLPDGISAHWFRHGHASHALARGASVAVVSQTLGHASVSTTSVYLHARPEDSSGIYLEQDI